MLVPKESKESTDTVETRLLGILAAVESERETKKDARERERVVLMLESTSTGYYKLIERVTGVEGDEKRTLREAVSSLYDKLVAEAREQERRGAERLLRLGVRT